MTAAQIVHDIQDSYNSAVSDIAKGEAAKATLSGIRSEYAGSISEITDETESAFIEALIVECEAAAE